MDNPVDKLLEDVEENQETPVYHRLAKAVLSAAAAVAASWAVERMYDRALDRDDETDDDETEKDI